MDEDDTTYTVWMNWEDDPEVSEYSGVVSIHENRHFIILRFAESEGACEKWIPVSRINVFDMEEDDPSPVSMLGY